jgi:hypothetical protein
MKVQNQSAEYRAGQLLRAQDLQGDVHREIDLHRLHNIHLHHTWGIAYGLEVAIGEDRRRITVSPGLAYDRHGQELLVAVTVLLEPPPNGPSVLVILHKTSYDTRVQGVFDCTPTASGSLPGRPLFAWRQPERVQRGLEVPLICKQPGGDLSAAVRHYATSFRRPFIAAGCTPPGTPWQCREVNSEEETPVTLGWSLRVDTSQAVFSIVPNYFASFAGDIFSSHLAMAEQLLGPFTSIQDPENDAFTFEVLFAVPQRLPPVIKTPLVHHLFEDDPPCVAWVAVEPP